jgi:hypothetical protein
MHSTWRYAFFWPYIHLPTLILEGKEANSPHQPLFPTAWPILRLLITWHLTKPSSESWRQTPNCGLQCKPNASTWFITIYHYLSKESSIQNCQILLWQALPSNFWYNCHNGSHPRDNPSNCTSRLPGFCLPSPKQCSHGSWGWSFIQIQLNLCGTLFWSCSRFHNLIYHIQNLEGLPPLADKLLGAPYFIHNQRYHTPSSHRSLYLSDNHTLPQVKAFDSKIRTILVVIKLYARLNGKSTHLNRSFTLFYFATFSKPPIWSMQSLHTSTRIHRESCTEAQHWSLWMQGLILVQPSLQHIQMMSFVSLWTKQQ